VSYGMLGNREEAAGIDDRVAVLVSSLKLVGDKLVLAGASKDALKASAPTFRVCALPEDASPSLRLQTASSRRAPGVAPVTVRRSSAGLLLRLFLWLVLWLFL
jgi:hypothetical protein